MDLTVIKNITIPEGEVTKITSSTNGVIWEKSDYIIVPITSANQMPCAKISVNAGDVVVIKYFITQNKGYIYDGRFCGLNYYGTVEGGKYPISDSDLNKECTITLNIPTTGFITVGANSTIINRGDDTPGQLSQFDGDIPIGRYIKFKIN